MSTYSGELEEQGDIIRRYLFNDSALSFKWVAVSEKISICLGRDGAYEKAKRGAESACLKHQKRRTLEEPRWIQFESIIDERMICLGEGKGNEQDPGDDPESDFTTGIPRKDAPSEADGHDEGAH